jgi:hypothetical protein
MPSDTCQNFDSRYRRLGASAGTGRRVRAAGRRAQTQQHEDEEERTLCEGQEVLPSWTEVGEEERTLCEGRELQSLPVGPEVEGE